MNFIKAFTKKYIYSAIGILLIIVVAVAINALLRKVNARYDLTQDKLYTLSQGTKNILGKLESPVTIRFYCSRSENQMPVQLRGFTGRLEDLLDEYVSAGRGKIILDKFDPQPDSEAEYSASMDGINGEMMPDGRKFYLGIAVNCLDKTIKVPDVTPYEENQLEYNMTRAIYEASQSKLPILGIMTDLPVMGGNTMPFMKSQAPKPPWIFVQELKKNFTVNPIPTKTTHIGNDVKILLIIHPQKLAPETVYAIDQYLLSGGRLVIAVDPFCLAEQRNSPQAMMGQQVMPGSSSIPELFKAWGISFSDQVLVDMDNSARNVNDPQSGSYPAVLDFQNIKNVSDDPAIAGITHLNLIYAGAFAGTPDSGISAKTFLESSRKEQLINPLKAQSPSAAILKEFVSSDKNEKLILKLAGKFKTAFPDGKPAKKDDKNPEAKTPPPPEENEKSLKESAKESAVVLLADVDMLSDEFCVSKQTLFGRTVVQPFNDNLNLIQNICGQLAGDNDLIKIRCRKVRERPFVELVKMQNEAQQKYEKKILEIEEEKENAQTKLNQMQAGKAESQKFIMSPEQKQEIENFRKKVAEKNKELKGLRKEFRKGIESTILRYEVANIAVVPVLVILFGLCVYIFNRVRSNRKR